MTLKDYIRLACGDGDENNPALSDSDIADVITAAILRPAQRQFIALALSSGARVTVLNHSGWAALALSALNRAGTVYGCGIGGFLDGMTDVYIGGELHELGEGDSVNNLTGIVSLAAAPEGAEVSVTTYLVDLPRAVHDALLLIAGSESRLAIKAQASGVGADMTGLADELRRQAREVLGQPAVEFLSSGDYPH